LFLNAHDYTWSGRTGGNEKENGVLAAPVKTSDSSRCDLIVSVAALPQTSNLGVGGSNPSERAKSSMSSADTKEGIGTGKGNAVIGAHDLGQSELLENGLEYAERVGFFGGGEPSHAKT
jgi:hypothetical protein